MGTLQPPEFESQRGHTWRMFHLLLLLITFGGHSGHLAYLVHKSGHKFQTSIKHLEMWLAGNTIVNHEIKTCNNTRVNGLRCYDDANEQAITQID